MGQRKRQRKRAAAAVPRLPGLVYAQASPHSIGGRSLFEADGRVTAGTVNDFASERPLRDRAEALLRQAGFEILRRTDETINFRGSPRAFEIAFGAPIVAEERPVTKPGQRRDTATFLECHNAERPGLVDVRRSRFRHVLEGVALEVPRFFMAAPQAIPPDVGYWHLDVPGGVALGCRAVHAHRAGVTGRGVAVAMVDSGHAVHPFFAAHGYRVDPVRLAPGAADPAVDSDGHGTGESANIFAVAPDATLQPVKTVSFNMTAAFTTAVRLNPQVISLSWGGDLGPRGGFGAADLALAAAVARAVASGIVVVVASGNGEYGFPGMHPDVISVGGVYVEPDGRLRASNYASGFDASYAYPGRRVPDVSGLVGLLPKAAWLLLPQPAGSRIDRERAGGRYPFADQTGAGDGWAAMSGTSASAPQLAGAAALVRQACPSLGPERVRDVLMASARDVRRGRCHPTQDNKARRGRDLATGAGLVDASRAVLLAKLVGHAEGVPGCAGVSPEEARRLAALLMAGGKGARA